MPSLCEVLEGSQNPQVHAEAANKLVCVYICYHAVPSVCCSIVKEETSEVVEETR